MEKLDIDEIIRKNPHLDRESLDALRRYIQGAALGGKARYRLAPIGTRHVTVAAPDPIHRRTRRTKSYPRF